MPTPAQILANQANARLSTGPRTPDGKASSARNARTHGLTAREVVVHPEEQPDFDQLLEDLTDELAPEGTLETLTFNNLVHAAWNQRRCRLLEAELAAQGLDPLLDPEAEAELTRIGRYAARAERSYYRALRELRILQTNRALRNELSEDEYGSDDADACEFDADDNNDEFKQNEANLDQEPAFDPIPLLADMKSLTKRTQSNARPHSCNPFLDAPFGSGPTFAEIGAQVKENYLAGLLARRQQENQQK